MPKGFYLDMRTHRRLEGSHIKVLSLEFFNIVWKVIKTFALAKPLESKQKTIAEHVFNRNTRGCSCLCFNLWQRLETTMFDWFPTASAL